MSKPQKSKRKKPAVGHACPSCGTRFSSLVNRKIVKHALIEHGWTQRELARRMGISSTTISLWIDPIHPRPVSQKRLSQLAQVLQVPKKQLELAPSFRPLPETGVSAAEPDPPLRLVEPAPSEAESAEPQRSRPSE